MRQESGGESRRKKRLKPSWQKTDVPKPVRMELYRIMRDYPTLTTRMAALSRSDELPKLETDFGIPPCSRDTFERLGQEIMEMPANEVCTLDQDLQDWILQLRPELGRELEKRKREQSGVGVNWIEEYEAKHGRLPPLPEPLGRLVKDYTPGQPVSKDMVVREVNIAEWNPIKRVRGLEKKARELLEWLGRDPDEYEYEVNRQRPPKGNPHPLTWKHPRRP